MVEGGGAVIWEGKGGGDTKTESNPNGDAREKWG